MVALSREYVMPGITVGVDGSDHSERALEWAAKEAGVRHVPLTVLAVHQVASNQWTGNPVTYPEDAPEVEKVRQAAEALTQKVIGHIQPGPTSVTVRAANDLASRALIEASADSDLVVVGSRGAGGFSRLMLGSVSSQVVGHAACPVVVVRDGK
jgi:nucleotide-binding universal stress UspA family protein